MNHLSLFTGIGGLDLAAEWAGFETVGQCEWADYPTKVLEKHWPDVPRWRDIRTLTGDSFYERTGLRTVDVVSGGFPCQPFSVAGKRRGAEDDRFLWPEMFRVIEDIRPRWVVGENVANIVRIALDQVLFDLESIGYTATALIIPACAVDAPHRRDRCAILAHADGCGSIHGQHEEQPAERPAQLDAWPCGEAVANAESIGLQGERPTGEQVSATRSRARQPKGGCDVLPDTGGECGGRFNGRQPAGRPEEYGWWPAEPGILRVANGVPHRVDRLRCLGNAVVPQQFYPIFKAIAEVEM